MDQSSHTYEIDHLLVRLAENSFRARFVLVEPELGYLRTKGMDTIRTHAKEFISKRLSSAFPPNDGKQTPFRYHPVFVAQHATATCCRGCLSEWHGIPKGIPLSDEQQNYVSDVIMRWLEVRFSHDRNRAKQGTPPSES